MWTLFLILALTSQPTTQPATQPTTPTPTGTSPAPAATKADLTTVEGLLAALEKADEKITTLSASIKFDQVKGVEGDRRIRFGQIWYRDPHAAPPAHRTFAIRFDRTQIGKRVDAEVTEYVFDGLFMVERRPALKQLIRQQVARPGDTFDPLRLGEGRFPLPIGQKAAAIRVRYDATLLKPAEELVANDPAEQKSLETFVEGAIQLKLIPKAELLPTEDLTEIRLWYREVPGPDGSTRLLPRLARTINRAGDVTIVQMVDVTLNQDIPSGVMDTQAPAGWEVDERLLPPAQPAPAAPSTPTSPSPAQNPTATPGPRR